VKEELMDLSLDKDSYKETLGGVIWIFAADKFAIAIRQSPKCYEKCIQIYIGYTEKS
jgi:hypothetical protein